MKNHSLFILNLLRILILIANEKIFPLLVETNFIVDPISISQFHSHAQYVQAVCLAGHTSCKHGGLYEWVDILFKMYYNWYISIIVKKYLHFTWRVVRQTNRLYVLRMIVKLAYDFCGNTYVKWRTNRCFTKKLLRLQCISLCNWPIFQAAPRHLLRRQKWVIYKTLEIVVNIISSIRVPVTPSPPLPLSGRSAWYGE